MEKSNSLYYYNSVDMFSSERSNVYDQYQHLPGHELFRYMFRLFNVNISMIDRTGNIVVPLKVAVAPQCTMPVYDPGFNEDFGDLCERRARQLLVHVQATGQKLTVLYSGGIDSTLILVSLLKAATDQELKDHVLVLLSDASINENPRFYYDHIIKRFNCASSYSFRDYLARPGYMVITGEGNDQLFGSAVMGEFSRIFGEQIISQAATDELMAETVYSKTENRKRSEMIVEIFNKNFNNAPVELPTIFHRYWWLNFTLKWQSVYMRLLAYTKPEFRSNIQFDYNYSTFFHVPELQQWAMKNTDRLINGSWLTYKQECKNIIYDYNRDSDYRDRKAKWGSLFKVVTNKRLAWCFDSDLAFYDDHYPAWVWEENNDFVARA